MFYVFKIERKNFLVIKKYIPSLITVPKASFFNNFNVWEISIGFSSSDGSKKT